MVGTGLCAMDGVLIRYRGTATWSKPLALNRLLMPSRDGDEVDGRRWRPIGRAGVQHGPGLLRGRPACPVGRMPVKVR